MAQDEDKDNPVKNFAITGYLKEFTKEKKDEKGVEPTLEDFNSAINFSWKPLKPPLLIMTTCNGRCLSM